MHALVTERLLLRRFRDEDGPALFDYLSDPETVQFEPYEPLTRGEADAEAARRAADEAFAAVCLRDGTLVGSVWLGQGEYDTFELGYVFGRRHWGYGYATEAARAVVDHAFTDLVAHRVIAMCATGNRASWRLAERLGMRREGLLRQNVTFRREPSGAPIWWDTYCYAVLAEEWLARPNSQKGP